VGFSKLESESAIANLIACGLRIECGLLRFAIEHCRQGGQVRHVGRIHQRPDERKLPVFDRSGIF
jgi:hypothetical protein